MRTIEEIKAGPLRLYSFVNYYLSDLQRGLQTAHVVAEIFLKYKCEKSTVIDWAFFNKTIIILNGGNCKSLRNIYQLLYKNSSGYPFDYFEEDQESLNGAISCVGLIFPEITKQDILDYADIADGADNFIDLMRLVRSYPLA